MIYTKQLEKLRLSVERSAGLVVVVAFSSSTVPWREEMMFAQACPDVRFRARI